MVAEHATKPWPEPGTHDTEEEVLQAWQAAPPPAEKVTPLTQAKQCASLVSTQSIRAVPGEQRMSAVHGTHPVTKSCACSHVDVKSVPAAQAPQRLSCAAVQKSKN